MGRWLVLGTAAALVLAPGCGHSSRSARLAASASTTTTTAIPSTTASPASISGSGAPPTTLQAAGTPTTAARPATTAKPATTTTTAPKASTSTTGTTVPAGPEITIASFTFSPNPLQVPVGAKVHAVNRETNGVAHTWTADAGQSQQWDSGNLAPGMSSAAVTFPTAGTFTYHCTIHATMTGTIIVG